MRFLSELWQISWFRITTVVVSLASVVFLIYSNSFDNEFVFDDFLFLTSEPYAIWDMRLFFELAHLGKQRLVGFFTFAVNYGISGKAVWSYHLVNTLIHLGNVVLVWCLVRHLTTTNRLKPLKKYTEAMALVTALVFATHPVQTQSVTYIVQRFASLATFFYLLAVYSYLKFRSHATAMLGKHSGSGRHYLWLAVVVIAGVLGLYTKEIIVSLPVMLLVTELMWLGRLKRRQWVYLGIAVSGLVVMTSVLLGSIYRYAFATKTAPTGEIITQQTYMLTQPRVLVEYVKILLWPTGLNVDRYFPVSTNISDTRIWLGIGLLGAIVAIAIGAIKRWPMISYGLIWFVVGLLVEAIMPLEDVIAEQRLYLPMVGFALTITGVWFYSLEELGKRWKKITASTWWWSTVVVTTVVIGSYSLLTYQRNQVWQNDLTLWQDTITKSPLKGRVYLNLGTAYQSRGQLGEAKKYYQEAIALGPPQASVYNNLAVLSVQEGKLEQGLEYFNQAMALDPSITSIKQNMAKVEKMIAERKKKVN